MSVWALSVSIYDEGFGLPPLLSVISYPYRIYYTPYWPTKWSCRFNLFTVRLYLLIQTNLDSSNTDGLFAMAYSNSFSSPYEILTISQENKYLGKFSNFIMKLYVMCTHWNCPIETVLMSTHAIPILYRRSKRNT